MNKFPYKVLVLWVILLTACDSSRVYEDYVNMEDAFWHMDSVQQFPFEIVDASKQYNVLATFRNSTSYPFYNIYFHYSLTDSLDSVVIEQLDKADLFDPVTGQPRGSGLGDMFDHSFPIMENYSFPSEGKYTLRLRQQMRLDTLPFILSVGARIEEANQE